MMIDRDSRLGGLIGIPTAAGSSSDSQKGGGDQIRGLADQGEENDLGAGPGKGSQRKRGKGTVTILQLLKR